MEAGLAMLGNRQVVADLNMCLLSWLCGGLAGLGVLFERHMRSPRPRSRYLHSH
jgi:hypothetical protein